MRKKARKWTDEELRILRGEYRMAEEQGAKPNLVTLAATLGRDKTGICRKARTLGLTKRKRKEPANQSPDGIGAWDTTQGSEPPPLPVDLPINQCGQPAWTGNYYRAGTIEMEEMKPCIMESGHEGMCKP